MSMTLSQYLGTDESQEVKQGNSFTAPLFVSLTSLSYLGQEVKPVIQSSAASFHIPGLLEPTS